MVVNSTSSSMENRPHTCESKLSDPHLHLHFFLSLSRQVQSPTHVSCLTPVDLTRLCRLLEEWECAGGVIATAARSSRTGRISRRLSPSLIRESFLTTRRRLERERDEERRGRAQVRGLAKHDARHETNGSVRGALALGPPPSARDRDDDGRPRLPMRFFS